jgi:GNAT superfamily N-acetyltransferase
MSKHLKQLILPELTSVALVDGKPIGAVFGMPDYNPRIREIDGRLFPFGFLKLLSRRKPFQRMRVISANVLPEYQGWGVGIVLLKGIVPALLASGIREVEFSFVLESNHLSRRSLERGGAILQKTFRVYDYAGDQPQPRVVG